MTADSMFEKLCHGMLDKFLEKNPNFATYVGLHEPYDYLMPSGSTKRLEGNLHLLEETIERLNTTVKKEELSKEQQIDWEVIETTYERLKFSFYDQQMYKLNPDMTDEIGGLIFIMFTRDYAPLEKRVDAIAARAEKIPKFLEEFRSRFQDSQPVKLWTEIAIEKAQNIGSLFQFILHATRGKVSDKIYARLTKAVKNLQLPLKVHMEWLHSLLPRTKEDWALGREKLEKLLRLRDLGMTSDGIYQLGVDYLKELKAKRSQLAQQIAPQRSEDEVLRRIESNAPKTFEEALELTRKTMEEAKHFVQKKNLATIHAEDLMLVMETPAFLSPVIPFAAMMPPAKFDKQQIGIYFVTRPKDPKNLGKHLNYPSIRTTSVHEAFPGHFLQTATSNRGSFVRLLAQGTETVEGWAHYCEEMMVEKGFIKDLETRLIQVNEMIWRAVRVIVDIKLSRGEMTFDEAVGMLVKETGMSKEGAVAEVKRYTQTPSQALSYLLGKHLILKLKEEVKQKLSDKFNERLFHDIITTNGYLPISMLRKVLHQRISELTPFPRS